MATKDVKTLKGDLELGLKVGKSNAFDRQLQSIIDEVAAKLNNPKSGKIDIQQLLPEKNLAKLRRAADAEHRAALEGDGGEYDPILANRVKMLDSIISKEAALRKMKLPAKDMRLIEKLAGKEGNKYLRSISAGGEGPEREDFKEQERATVSRVTKLAKDAARQSDFIAKKLADDPSFALLGSALKPQVDAFVDQVARANKANNQYVLEQRKATDELAATAKKRRQLTTQASKTAADAPLSAKNLKAYGKGIRQRYDAAVALTASLEEKRALKPDSKITQRSIDRANQQVLRLASILDDVGQGYKKVKEAVAPLQRTTKRPLGTREALDIDNVQRAERAARVENYEGMQAADRAAARANAYKNQDELDKRLAETKKSEQRLGQSVISGDLKSRRKDADAAVRLAAQETGEFYAGLREQARKTLTGQDREAAESRAADLIKKKRLTDKEFKDVQSYFAQKLKDSADAYTKAVEDTKRIDSPEAQSALAAREQARKNLQRLTDLRAQEDSAYKTQAELRKRIRQSESIRLGREAAAEDLQTVNTQKAIKKGLTARRDRAESNLAALQQLEAAGKVSKGSVVRAADTVRSLNNALQNVTLLDKEINKQGSIAKERAAQITRGEAKRVAKEAAPRIAAAQPLPTDVANVRSSLNSRLKEAIRRQAVAEERQADGFGTGASVTRAKSAVAELISRLQQLAPAAKQATAAQLKLIDAENRLALERNAAAARRTATSLGAMSDPQFSHLIALAKDNLKRAVRERDLQAGAGTSDPALLQKARRNVEDSTIALDDLIQSRKAEQKAIAEQRAATTSLTKAHDSAKDSAKKARQDVRQAVSVAEPIFRKQDLQPSAKNLKNIDFSALSSAELKEINKVRVAYEKEAQILARLVRLKKELANQRQFAAGGGGGGVGGGPPPTLPPDDPSRNKRMQELVGITRSYHDAVSALNNPLGQMTRLFNQFFRYALGYGALYQVLTFFQYLTRSVVDLNKELYSIQAIAGSTAAEMGSLGDTIKDVAVSSSFTLTEVATAAKTLVQAGVAMKDIPKVLKSVTKFAVAAETSLETSADLITTFRDVFSDVDESTIANQLTRAVNISKLTAEEMKTIFSLSAQTAEGFNISSEQYLAAVSTLRNAGIKASTTATGLRQAMLELFNADDKTLKALEQRYKDLGENLTGNQIKARFFGFSKGDNPLIEAVGELKRLGFGGESQKSLQRVFDIRAVNAIQALVSNFKELESSASRITFGEAAAEAADVQMRSLSNSVKQLGTAMAVFTASLTEGPIEGLETLADKATAAVNKLNTLDLTLKESGRPGLYGSAGEAIGGALTGAYAGARLGGERGGIGAAAVGGIAGGVAGTVVDVDKQVEDLNKSFPILSTLFQGGVLLALAAVFRKVATAGSAIANIWKAVKSTSGIWSKVGTLITVTPVGRIVTTIVGLGLFLYQLFDFLDLWDKIFPEAELDKAKRTAKAARTKLEQRSTKKADLLASADALTVDSDIPEGSTASGIKKLQDLGLEADRGLEDLFGPLLRLTREKLEEYEGILDNYVDLRTEERRAAFDKLLKNSPLARSKDRTFETTDYQLNQLLQKRDEYRAGTAALISDIGTELSKAYEVLQSDVERTSSDYLKAVDTVAAYQNVAAGASDVEAIVLGFQKSTDERMSEIILQIATEKARLLRDRAYNLNKGEDPSVAAKAAVEGAVAAGKAQAKPGQEIDLTAFRAAIFELGRGLNDTSDASKNFLLALVGELDNFLSGLKNEDIVGPLGDALRVGKKLLQDEVAANAAAVEAERKRQNEGAVASIRSLPKLAEDPNFTTQLDKLPPSNKTAEKLRELLRTPEAIDEWLTEATAGGERGLDVVINGKVKLRSEIQDLLDLIRELFDVGVGIKNSEELAHTRELMKGESDSKKRELELKAKASRIERGSRGYVSTEYGQLGIDSSANVYRQIAEEEKSQLENRLTRLREQHTELINKTGKSGTDYDKNIDKILVMEDQIAELEAQRGAIDAETTEKIRAVQENAERLQLQRREKLIALIKEGADYDVSSGLEDTSDGLAVIVDSINTANDDLLKVYQDQLDRLGLEVTGKGEAAQEEYSIMKQELEQRRRQLRAVQENAEELERLASLIGKGTDRLAAAVLATPVTEGDPGLDVRIQKAGGQNTDAARLSKLSNDEIALEAQGAELRKRRDFLATQKIDPARDQEVLANIAAQKEASNALTEINYKLAEIELERAQVLTTFGDELDEAFDLDVLASKVRAMDSSLEHLGETLQDSFVSALDQLGDVIVDVIDGTTTLKEGLKELAHQFAKDQIGAMVKAALGKVVEIVIAKYKEKFPDKDGKAEEKPLPPETQQVNAATTQKSAADTQAKAAQDQTLAGQDQRIAAQQMQAAASMLQTCPCPGEGGGGGKLPDFPDIEFPDGTGESPTQKGTVIIDDNLPGGVAGPTTEVSTPPFLDPSLTKPDIQIPASNGIGQIGDNSADRLPTTSVGTDPASPVKGIVDGFRNVMDEIGFSDLFASLGSGIKGLGSSLGGLFKSFVGLFSGGQAGVSNKQTGAAFASQLGGAIGGVWGAVLQGGAAIYSASQEENAATGGINKGGKMVRGYRKGGVLRGRGTATSDSLRGVMIDGKGSPSPIAVGNGEAVLTGRAVDMLGESFVNDINSGKMSAFDSRSRVERSHRNTRSATPASSFTAASVMTSPKVELTMVNAVDSPSVLESALNTPVGGEKMINFFRVNKSRINTTLGRR